MVEYWSPKPAVGSSSLSTRANRIKKMSKLKVYLQETYDELVNKVSWPTWSELQNSAVIVMVATFIIAIVVFLMDVSLKSIMEVIYGLFK